MSLIRINISLYALLLLVLIACNDAERVDDAKNIVDTSKLDATDTSLKWVDYRNGELPPVGYYDVLDSIIRKWGIRYERVEGGCEIVEGEKEKYEKHNYKYFEVLSQKYGKDWRQKFDAEVAALDSILLIQNRAREESISKLPAVKCVDKGGDMESGFTEECTYFNSTLVEAYASYRVQNLKNDDGKYLESVMPVKPHTAGFEDYPLSIVYKYPKPNILDIEIGFPGGVTYITFKQQGDNVKVITISSPD